MTGKAPPDAWKLVTKQAQLPAPHQLQHGISPATEAALLRAQSDRQYLYEFDVSSDGYFQVNLRTADGWTTLIKWTSSPAILQGVDVTNHLAVECVGEQFSFYVNDTHLADVRDATFRSGNVGLSATAIGEGGVVVAFDNVTARAP